MARHALARASLPAFAGARCLRPWHIVGARRAVPDRGTALLTVLVLVVIVGLGAAKAGQSLGALMQREREAELLWRGQQYRQAIARYYGVKHGAQQMFPPKLEDLVRDPRFPGTVRHLRRLYADPMTGQEWELVKDPAERIIGVRSASDLEPFQQAGFPKGLEDLEGKSAYREWEFVYVPTTKKSVAPRPAGTAPGSPFPATPPGTPPASPRPPGSTPGFPFQSRPAGS